MTGEHGGDFLSGWGGELDRLEACLESLSEQIELQVARADHGAPRGHAVEVTQEQILRIPRAAIHLVDDLDRVDPEKRMDAKGTHPLLHGFDGDELAVELFDGKACAGQFIGDHVGDAGFANTGRAIEQDLHRRGGVIVQLSRFGDQTLGDDGRGAAEVIGGLRPPREWRRACGDNRFGQNLEWL